MDFASRSSYRGQVTKLVKSATEYLQSDDSKIKDTTNNLDDIEEELTVMLDRLTAAHESLKKANGEVVPLIKSDDLGKEADAVAEYEDKAISTITRIKLRLSKLRLSQGQMTVNNHVNDSSSMTALPPLQTTTEPSNFSAVKLQKLQPKKFSGEFKDWVPFWEQYRVLVHENPSLSTIDKFNYLETVLIGKAGETLAGLTPSEANYATAIMLLKEEYGNSEKIIDFTMQRLLSIQPVSSKTDAVSLRRLYTSVLSSTRSLSALGIPSSNYFVMLKGVLLRCIPNELRVDFHRYYEDSSANLKGVHQNCEDEAGSNSSASENSSITISDSQVNCLLKFLKREVESLEKANEAKLHLSRFTVTSTSSRAPVKTALGLFTSEKDNNFCFFCNSTNHESKECCCQKSIPEKKKMLVTDGRCFRCCKKGHNSRMCRVKGITCKTCNGHHATSMCDPSYSPKKNVKPVAINNDAVVNLYTSDQVKRGITYLQTACAYASSESSTLAMFVRIVMDGGSQLSFIKSTVARRLNLPIVGEHNLSVITFGSDKPKPSKLCNRVRLVLRSQFDDQAVVLDAIEVPSICFDGLSEPKNDQVVSTVNLKLADNRAYGQTLEDGISVLIGADAYWQFATGENKRLTDKLTAINTILGWTIQGPSTIDRNESDSTCAISLNVCSCDDIQRFWKMDILGIASEDKKGVSGDVSLHVYRKGDRFEASLPWKKLSTPLHNYRTGAFTRMQSLVRKLCAAGKIIDYDEAMLEMFSAGIAEPVPENVVDDNILYYLPHRPVYREDKDTTKLRIVFDASAHAPNHSSLNDVLEVGENFLPDLLLILLNFRVGKVGLISDIEKAFLQISLKPSDRDSHRFLWFAEKIVNEKSLPAVRTYRMTRLTFGVKSSPYILGAMIQELIKEASNRINEKMVWHRSICDLLKNSFYMDDFVASLHDEKFATEVYREATGIFESASMKLRKWNSNHPRVRDCFAEEEQFSATPKVLGLRWVIATDELQVDLNSVLSLLDSSCMQGTKRSVLRVMAKIFDPFGVLSPWTVRLKILFQNMWRKKLEWDEDLSPDLQCIWATCRNEINELNEIVIPRYLSTSEEGSTEIHVFADASHHAFGAVAYARTVHYNGEITVRFICAKNRVAPLKNDDQNELTIPKLELTAALIAARLLAYLQANLRITVGDTFLWSDSQIVLYWILGSNKRWKPFVENRVNEIKALSNLSSWRHCPGVENPADLLTRGVSASSLMRSSIWFNGPSWLIEDKSFWPLTHNTNIVALCTLSLKTDDNDVQLKYAEPILNAENFSTLTHLLRVTACVFRAIERFRKREFDYISAEDIAKAENYWIHQVQRQHFLKEISSLQEKKAMPPNSKLISLLPFLDDKDKFLRVGGRLQDVEDNINIAHPIILPKSSHITKLIVNDLHSRIFHGGTSAVLSYLRSKYWIIRGRQIVKTVIKNCFVCKLLRGQAATQPFAPLPKDRILSSRAFEVTGVDFAGPLHVSDASGQRKKFYILLFTCAAVRAVHLESTNDLTAESCILAIRRFIARRGVPRIIYSDNATTFKKTSSEFKLLRNVRSSERFLGFLSDSRITWKFIVERAPWWGGFWERLVGLVKTALRAAVRRATLNNDQLHTLLTEVECVVNSRPLTYMGDDPLDLAPLTPANFLNASYGTTQEFASENQTGNALRKQWKERMLFLAVFKKRWFKEYLLQLRSLHHVKNYSDSNLKVGDVVLVEDSSLPRPLWHLAVIQKVFPGRDGKIRACEIRLSSGSILRRPIQLLYPLEISNSS